jgi:hypothetical protein
MRRALVPFPVSLLRLNVDALGGCLYAKVQRNLHNDASRAGPAAAPDPDEQCREPRSVTANEEGICVAAEEDVRREWHARRDRAAVPHFQSLRRDCRAPLALKSVPSFRCGGIGVRVLEAVTRGKGHAPDLATLPIACILSSSQVNRIESRTTPEDHASEQIKQKLEVTYEGTNRRAVSSHGTLHDMKILPAASLAMGWRVVLG